MVPIARDGFGYLLSQIHRVQRKNRKFGMRWRNPEMRLLPVEVLKAFGYVTSDLT